MLPKRVYTKINLDNIQKNMQTVRQKFGDEMLIMGIVKANAYGHGAVEVAKALVEYGANVLGVAAIDEAVELRENGIDAPILILGQIFRQDYQTAIENDVTCTVVDIVTAQGLSKKATELGKVAKVHIKIDTGMGRIGFQPDLDGENDIKSIFKLENLSIDGAFTHFANADISDKTSANEQKQKFIAFTDKLINEGYNFPIRHMYNSASAMELEGYAGEMVRCGIMLYGLYPSNEMKKDYKLYPALEFKSSVSFVKSVKKGFTVSYGSTYVTEKDMKIATVPAGYGDGYPRYLSNKGEVLIRGTRCRILGKVCMDQFMVDVSHLPDVQIADEVTLVGTDGNETITIEDVSDKNARFNYEFCCLITPRVPRIYIKDGKIIE
ncbi:MAG: alanine racemase [Clostridia bacterium]|nr:alanine racemase [Clostridia bacterium]